jgi:hypothetical protein
MKGLLTRAGFSSFKPKHKLDSEISLSKMMSS